MSQEPSESIQDAGEFLLRKLDELFPGQACDTLAVAQGISRLIDAKLDESAQSKAEGGGAGELCVCGHARSDHVPSTPNQGESCEHRDTDTRDGPWKGSAIGCACENFKRDNSPGAALRNAGAREEPSGRVYMARGISPESWLNAEHHEWFRRCYEYATTKTNAIYACSETSPENLYWFAFFLLRELGFDELPPTTESLKRAGFEQCRDGLADAFAGMPAVAKAEAEARATGAEAYRDVARQTITDMLEVFTCNPEEYADDPVGHMDGISQKLHAAEAKVAAWEPVVRAAIENHDRNHSTGALSDAVEALAAEFHPAAAATEPSAEGAK